MKATGSAVLAFNASPATGAPLGEMTWRTVCQSWLKAVVPADEHGPGADNPQVWAQLELLMVSEKAWGQQLEAMFVLLRDEPVPRTEHELSNRLMVQDAQARFLQFFQSLVIGFYYGTQTGWHDLGLHSPPQPSGYALA